MKSFVILMLLCIILLQVVVMKNLRTDYTIMTWVANTLALDFKSERNLYLSCKNK